MVFAGCIDAKRRAYITFLARDQKVSTKEIMKRCQVSRSTVIKNKRVGGRPNKLCPRDERNIMRSFHALRKEGGQFSSNRLMQRAGLKDNEVSNRTIRRFLYKKGYRYLQARKKALMTQCDMHNRVQFAKNIQEKFSGELWKTSVSFFLDRVNFFHKTNLADQARAPKGIVWREKSEGLKQGCLAKGSKEGSGGCVLRLMAAISYGEGVIECHQYTELDSSCFAQFIENKIDGMFAKAGKNGCGGSPSNAQKKSKTAANSR